MTRYENKISSLNDKNSSLSKELENAKAQRVCALSATKTQGYLRITCAGSSLVIKNDIADCFVR